ncbi:unnamed protein product [Vitrella brassicaformis CCMP3155]|uniref:Uncharacterized protein n=1 Tax=Vitrella brassicaformis (strain CCMP3155) TaxID=1169540 RepID=A0A0G4FFF9_VITBC|nr:unnamed protein product [Vitrella brassicaformis CCMP3155]|eukprot:CEM11920.1 unnamed protein product [Vitrella brassicaformis CCMP3155]
MSTLMRTECLSFDAMAPSHTGGGHTRRREKKREEKRGGEGKGETAETRPQGNGQNWKRRPHVIVSRRAKEGGTPTGSWSCSWRSSWQGRRRRPFGGFCRRSAGIERFCWSFSTSIGKEKAL